MSEAIRALFDERTFLTGAGAETFLVFEQDFELPEFCGFVVFDDPQALAALERALLHPILDAAHQGGFGLLLDALVWRAQADYLEKIGRGAAALAAVNARAVAETRASVERWRARTGAPAANAPVLITADIGPRGDGYAVDDRAVRAEDARDYHVAQLDVLARAGVDIACALTMTTAAESVGITQAAERVGLPVIVSPTVETDGRLPDETLLGDFVERVDDETGGAPLFYMVNCAHPDHLRGTLDRARADGAAWLDRLRGFRANASRKSHAELDESAELDRGDPEELAALVADLRTSFGFEVVGGCCGTDAAHIEAMARALRAA